jgi:adsorption protein B
MVVFHDAEGMVDPAALGLHDEGIAFGADFVG